MPYGDECIEINSLNIKEFCTSYNTEKLCVSCRTGYNVQDGICCPNNYYLDIRTSKCSHHYPNCNNFSHNLRKCLDCKAGFYLMSDNCCRIGTQWNDKTK